MEKEILEKFDSGLSVKEIVSELDTSMSAVYRILKKHNRNKKKKFDIEKETLEELYLNQKLSMSEIGRQYGVSKPTIEKLIKSKDIPVRSHKETCQIVNDRKVPEIPSKEVLESLYSTMSIRAMCSHFNVGQQTIYKWLNHHEINLGSLSERCEKIRKINREKAS